MFKRSFEALISGILTACAALVLQIFISFISDVVSHQSFTLENLSQSGLTLIVVYFLINALIEETFRTVIIAYRIFPFVRDSFENILFSSFFLGFGFWSFEITLRYFSSTATSHLLLLAIPALLIHVAMSLLIILFLQMKKVPTFIIVLCATILHALSNLILYFFVG